MYHSLFIQSLTKDILDIQSQPRTSWLLPNFPNSSNVTINICMQFSCEYKFSSEYQGIGCWIIWYELNFVRNYPTFLQSGRHQMLVRIWNDRNSHTLLLRMLNKTANWNILFVFFHIWVSFQPQYKHQEVHNFLFNIQEGAYKKLQYIFIELIDQLQKESEINFMPIHQIYNRNIK